MKLTDIFKCITEKRVKVITPDNKVKMRVTWEDIVDISWCIPEEISKEWLIEASKAFNDKDGRRLYDLLYFPLLKPFVCYLNETLLLWRI